MAKKTKETGDLLIDGIVKKYGAIIESGTKVLETLETFEVLSISPALDLALGGGLREGQCVNMTGDPKTGKTTTALYFAAKAQAVGKRVFYLNTEGRMTKENFRGIKGLDIEKISIIQATDEKPEVSAETYLNTLETLIKQEPNLVCIVDSASSMVPQDELDGEIRTGVRNALPRLLAMFFKRISGDVCRMKAIIIFITHNIANTGGQRFAPLKHADCGNMLQYQVGTNMIITHRGRWEVPKESGNHVGQVVNWRIETSAAGGIPKSIAESWLRYGIGLDEAQEICHIATQFALVGTKGAWYTISCFLDNKDDPVVKKWIEDNEILKVLTKEQLDEMTEKQVKKHHDDNEEATVRAFKFQGMDNLCTFITENEELQNFLINQVREILL